MKNHGKYEIAFQWVCRPDPRLHIWSVVIQMRSRFIYSLRPPGSYWSRLGPVSQSWTRSSQLFLSLVFSSPTRRLPSSRWSARLTLKCPYETNPFCPARSEPRTGRKHPELQPLMYSEDVGVKLKIFSRWLNPTLEAKEKPSLRLPSRLPWSRSTPGKAAHSFTLL